MNDKRNVKFYSYLSYYEAYREQPLVLVPIRVCLSLV